MFNITRTILFLFACFYLPLLSNAQKCIIKGEFINAGNDTIKIVYSPINLNTNELGIITLMSNGKFEIAIDIYKKQEVKINLYNKNFNVLVKPNAVIEINGQVNYSSISSNFEGDLAMENRILNEFYKRFDTCYTKSLWVDKLREGTIDKAEIWMYEQKMLQTNFVKENKDLKEFPELLNFITKKINYRYWCGVFAHPIETANANRSIVRVNSIPATLLEGFENKVLNEKDLICESFRQLLYYTNAYYTSEANEFNKFKDMTLAFTRKMMKADELLKGENNIWMHSELLSQFYKSVSPMQVKQVLEKIKEVGKLEAYNREMDRICGPYSKEKLKKEKNNSENVKSETDNIPNTPVLTDLEGNKVKLSDFKGKVVYIDFWASWCGPCKGMFPYSKELHKKFSEEQLKKIVFLYISIDQSVDGWKKAVEQNQLEGVNLISPGNWSSEVCKYFKINSIPRYMIMNKKGEMIEFNAKRPADPTLFDDLIKLIED